MLNLKLTQFDSTSHVSADCHNRYSAPSSKYDFLVQQMFIRGSQIRLAMFPEMLRHAPMFKLAKNKGKGLGIGQQRRAMVMRARAGGNVFLSGQRGGRGGAKMGA